MKVNKVKNNFDKSHYQFYEKELKKYLNKGLEFFAQFGYDKELLKTIKKIYKYFIAELDDKYLIGIVELLNFDKGKAHNGKILKKYFGSFGLLNSAFMTFELLYLWPEIRLYQKYYSVKFRPAEYFNNDKIKYFIDGYFAIVPVFEVGINYKIEIEHKRKSSTTEYKIKELYPAIKRISDSLDKCELRQALVMLENNFPGAIDKAGETLHLNYKKLIKEEYEQDQKNFRERKKRSKRFSNDDLIEYKTRALAKEIKSGYTSFLKSRH